jgi:hypothetical protein
MFTDLRGVIMKLRNRALLAIGVATALATAHSSLAQFPSLPKAPSMGTSSSASPAEDLGPQQEQLVRAYVAADIETLQGQARLAEALDLKDRAAKLDAEVKALSSGSTQSADELKKADTVINDAQPEIDAKLKQHDTLSKNAMASYGKGLEHLALGVVGTVKLKDEANTFQQSVQAQMSKASLQDRAALTSKLAGGTYVAGHLPGHLKGVTGGLQSAVSFAQNHGIPVPASATDVLRQNAMALNH